MLTKIQGVLLSSFLLICCVGEAKASPYKSGHISDVRTNLSLDQRIELSTRSIDLSISYESGKSLESLNFSDPYITRQVYLSEIKIREYNKSLGIRTADCRSSYNLNIFVLSNETMWEEDRFYSYKLRTNLGSERLVYGFYDPTSEVRAENSLILTNVNSYENRLTTQHELAHYWYDRMCVGIDYSGSSESYALGYEAFVRRNYEDFN